MTWETSFIKSFYVFEFLNLSCLSMVPRGWNFSLLGIPVRHQHPFSIQQFNLSDNSKKYFSDFTRSLFWVKNYLFLYFFSFTNTFKKDIIIEYIDIYLVILMFYGTYCLCWALNHMIDRALWPPESPMRSWSPTQLPR